MEYHSKYNVNFHYSSRLKKFTKIWPYPNVFLKIFNNFENSFPSTKQLWMAASSFPEKSWRYLVTRIFVGQNIRKPVSYSPFLSDGSAIIINFLKESRAKIKVYTFFFIINSIFHLRLPRDVNFRLKIANFWLFFVTTYRLLDVKTLKFLNFLSEFF